MYAPQLFVIAVSVAMGVCGRRLNFFSNNGAFQDSVFDRFTQGASAIAYGIEDSIVIGDRIVDEFNQGAFASIIASNSSNAIFDTSSIVASDSNDTLSYFDLNTLNVVSSNGSGDVFFETIGTSDVDFGDGSSLAGFDFSTSAFASSDNNATIGQIVDAFSLAREGFSSAGATICVGATCI